MTLPNIFLVLTAIAGLGQTTQSIVKVEPVSPLRYEQQDGHLKILSSVVLSSGQGCTLTLDGELLDCGRTGRADSVTVWLPMVGGRSIMECRVNGNATCSRSIPAPIAGDWGYFQNGEIHLMQASHQDIAWMDTPDYCRNDRIENIIIPALEMMKEDPDFTFEMEQTLNLMEFLEEFPERRDEVIQRYKEGRFLWGATYNQPYEGLSSGEQLVRQAYYGRKWIKENLPGCDDFTASNMDVPGRTLQMPQILAKSGIRNLFISRMAEGLYDWTAPDGTSILTYSLGHYGWEKFIWHFLDQGPVNAFQKVHARLALWQDYYAERHLAPCYGVLMSNDAAKPDSYTELVNAWNDIAEKSEIPLPRIKYSTTDEYLSKVVLPESDVPDIYGERPDLWLYIHGPAHYEQTLDKRKAAVLLPAAEFFATANYLRSGARTEYPRTRLDRGWMASIYPDHGLGGKNGEITDAIFADSLAMGKAIGLGVLADELGKITRTVEGRKGDVVVFNDLSWDRKSLVEVFVQGKGSRIVKGPSDAVVPSEIVTRNDSTFVRFMADVPAFGYARFRILSGKPEFTEGDIRLGDNWCSNAYYDIAFGVGGIVRLYDKQLGKDLVQNEKYALGDILNAEYHGNGAGEFLRITDIEVPYNGIERAPASAWKVVRSSGFSVTYEKVIDDPFAKIIQSITVYHRQKKIDFDVRMENFTGEHSRQYRILFPLDMKTDQSDICYEVPMAVSHVNKDELDMRPGGYTGQGSYRFHPSDTHPREVLNFISANGNGFGCTLSSCVAVCDWEDPAHEVADYPVLQGILLSSHKSCHSEGNWYHQTGTHDFHFSLTTHPEGWQNGYAMAVEENHPLHVMLKDGKGGYNGASESFLKVSDPLVWVPAFKKADGCGNAVILRLVEMEGTDKEVRVTLPFTATKVEKCNLVEEYESDMDLKGNVLNLHIGHNAIETYKIFF